MARLRRLYRWFRDRPTLVDSLWAALIALTLALPTASGMPARLSWAWPWLLAWCLVFFVLPLVWRRRHPDVAMALVATGCLIHLFVTDTITPILVVPGVMLYAVAAYGRLGLRRWWLAAALLGGVAGAYDWGYRGRPAGVPAPEPQDAIVSWLFVAAMTVACYVPGVLARQRRELVRTLRERAESLERERDSMSRLAAQEERGRIAREMHDVVAHSLSVIVVQADGASYAVQHGDPAAAQELAGRTLTTIGDAARAALTETRRLVGVLRDPDQGADYAPQATMDQLDELVQGVRDAGLPATLTVHGDPAGHAPLGTSQHMAAYRVVQEALTNVLKHAGPRATVAVDVRHEPDRIVLAVRDTGLGRAPSDGYGHGLIGMRERMTALGGDFVARERVAGGFEVLASLPTDAPAADASRGRP
ncbi:sensor histidine kinase [Arsenicicoccus sp. oral taxon 190]|uniref:sensor histidine kinase n=1 Tax=Arsenicicoccus sp. oral taxon 190 TaxID=1658671 RepID=UPI000679ED68|nr:histidine kinase [Arsenicicoccus sp. oral taxon 190]AKT51113.1 hypothetical protein ADJ73_06905 [Arsenicicoccus sp. oral taxon 190]